jgi:hypothetical protein
MKYVSFYVPTYFNKIDDLINNQFPLSQTNSNPLILNDLNKTNGNQQNLNHKDKILTYI